MTFETTQDIQLKCSAKGNHRGVVFHPWTQKIGSRLIRTFDGFNTDNETVVKIPYNKPVITDTIKIQEHKGNAEILVDFYSVPKPVKVDWMKEGAVISLSEKYRQSNTVVQVTLTLHEVRVQLKGYRAKLTITNVTDDDFGTYVLRIENFKGIATQQTLVLTEKY
ncbi:hypothetical protein KUTeg_011273 [Tegillarca granosa]|uniref:Ig-like domain-containing protein n=1 Tax=Tegillarca granosa TaxID=220873 RepID=A0ABQ9F5I9_TEGGR|nr:hypothetical protein KUTeg_011273 [Tegillarca granosa]